jgi:Bromodomain
MGFCVVLCLMTGAVTWQEQASKDVLKKLKDDEEVDAFLEPVDWKSLGLNDYPMVIKRPMDLKTVTNKLKKNEYKKADDFFDDINLIWNNCQTYNEEESELHQIAVRLQKDTAAMREKFFADRRKYREEVLGETLADRLARRIARLDGDSLAKLIVFIRQQAGYSITEDSSDPSLMKLNLTALEEGHQQTVNQLCKELLKSA